MDNVMKLLILKLRAYWFLWCWSRWLKRVFALPVREALQSHYFGKEG